MPSILKLLDNLCRAMMQSNSHYNSMVKENWNTVKQQEWLRLKREAINRTKEFLSQTNNLNQVYAGVAELRYNMAVLLDQDNKTHMGVFRKNEMTARFSLGEELTKHIKYLANKIHSVERLNTKNEGQLYTKIRPFGPYQDFYPYLLNRFEELKSKYPGKIDPTYRDGEHFVIDHGGIPATRLIKDLSSAYNGIKIEHTSVAYIHYFMNLSAQYYRQLMTEDRTDEDRIRTIKYIIWCYSQATPCWRGSASITEIIAQALFEKYNLDFYIPQNRISIDLLALFSATPEEFCELLKPGSAKDKLADELINYINTRGSETRSILNFFYDKIGIPSEIKLSAAEKLLKEINGAVDIIYSPEELQALKQDRLGELIKPFTEILSERVNNNLRPPRIT